MKEKVTRILWMLVAQFFLGMALNVIGEPSPEMATLPKVAAYVLFAAHVVLAVGLAVTAAQILRADWKADVRGKQLSTWGLWSLFLAIIAGGLTVAAPWGELWSFVMASGFMLALICFGKLLIHLKASA